METRIMNIQSGIVFENRRDAKMKMGHANYNRALREGNIMFLNNYSTTDILF